jgi:multiple sugar transport system permease protein
VTRRALSQQSLGWLLCAPAVLVMAVVTAYPILYAFWLSLFRYDLRFPSERRYVGLANYVSVFGSDLWWQSLGNTALLTAVSVAVELILGLSFALVMHRSPMGRWAVRSGILVPYAMITVVAAMAWRFAFDPTTGFVNALLELDRAWLTERGSALFVIIFTEVWKTTPFMALLMLAGLTLVPEDLLRAARVDGASGMQRLFRITLPLMKPSILVALLFRTLDAFRIFDTVFIQTRGAQNTETVSLIGYQTLIVRLNLGLGSAVSVLIFVCVILIALLFVKGFGAGQQRRGGS